MHQTAFNFNPSLSPEECAVLSCLGHGRGAAVSSTEIVKKTGLTVRRIQQVVRRLRLEHGYSIGSATTDPMGYYLTSEQGDNVEMARKLRARGIKVLMLAARFSKRSLRMEFDQGVIEQEGEG
jgi:biotin operon repressor